jgi:tRNA threonylcarbamoyladenosine biosynthesis protein TsaB
MNGAAATVASGLRDASGGLGAVWLAIDTATDSAGIALLGGGVLAEETWTTRRRHTVQLAPKVARMLAEHQGALAALAGIAVAIGPGSYTGLRVGLAFAKGLALGADLPVVGVPTLDVLAVALSPPHVPRAALLWAVLSAGRGRVVAGAYPPSPAAWPDPSALGVWTAAELVAAARPGDWVAGELSEELRRDLCASGCTVLSAAACVRRAGWLAALGRARVASAPPSLDALAPVYLA